MHGLLIKFLLVFVGGVSIAVVVTQVILPRLADKNHPPLLPKTSSQPDILGSNSLEEETTQGKVKTFVQNTLNQVVDQFAQSKAVAPLVETSQSVQKAVKDVQSLPDSQKAAICREICTP